MMDIRKVFAAGLAGVLALPLLTASAEAANWWIERMSGNVQIHDGETWVRLDQDRELNAGDSIWTGRNGRILLMNDQGSVLLAPKSLVKIPAQALPSNFSVLFQTHGMVSAEVDRRGKRHFSIQTPYLAAVVKGTQFDVEVAGEETRVAVREGLVGVVDVETGKTVDVPAGTVMASATDVGGRPSGMTVTATAHDGAGDGSSSSSGSGSGSSSSSSSGTSSSGSGSSGGSSGGSGGSGGDDGDDGDDDDDDDDQGQNEQ